MNRWICILILAAVAAEGASGATITVRRDGSGDFAVIQHALDVAADGDTILVGPGEYLEHSTVRFPAWSWDIESYANVMVDDLTIIGAGADQTFIGPATYSGSYSTESPKALTYLEGGDITISEVCIRNTHTGIFMTGRLFMDDCSLTDNYINVGWEAVGSGGWIRNSQFDVWTPNWPISIDIVNNSGASGILVENCTVQHSMVLIDGVNGALLKDCQFSNGLLGLQLYGNAFVSLDNCVLDGMSAGGIELEAFSSAVCHIRDSVIGGGNVALAAMGTDSRFDITNSRLIGGTVAVFLVDSGSANVVSGCDLVKGSGPVVRCRDGSPIAIHDLRNNYWGTTDEATIQSWIIDHSDNSSIGATVLYSPFAGQSVPTESTSWGDLKALWR